MPLPAAIECLVLRPGREDALATFFSDLREAGDEAFFHPHAGDVRTLRAIAAQPGSDVYVVLVESGRVLAYGLLRGWNEGYSVPSLGIAVHPDARGAGLGRLMMEYLEAIARRRGAPSVRLRVHKDNGTAREMYVRRGYMMSPDPGNELLMVGIKELDGDA